MELIHLEKIVFILNRSVSIHTLILIVFNFHNTVDMKEENRNRIGLNFLYSISYPSFIFNVQPFDFSGYIMKMSKIEYQVWGWRTFSSFVSVKWHLVGCILLDQHQYLAKRIDLWRTWKLSWNTQKLLIETCSRDHLWVFNNNEITIHGWRDFLQAILKDVITCLQRGLHLCLHVWLGWVTIDSRVWNTTFLWFRHSRITDERTWSSLTFSLWPLPSSGLHPLPSDLITLSSSPGSSLSDYLYSYLGNLSLYKWSFVHHLPHPSKQSLNLGCLWDWLQLVECGRDNMPFSWLGNRRNFSPILPSWRSPGTIM